jgi:hypothetical protein
MYVFMITLYLHWQLKILANSVFFLILKNTMCMPDVEATKETIGTNSKEIFKVKFLVLSQL